MGLAALEPAASEPAASGWEAWAPGVARYFRGRAASAWPGPRSSHCQANAAQIEILQSRTQVGHRSRARWIPSSLLAAVCPSKPISTSNRGGGGCLRGLEPGHEAVHA